MHMREARNQERIVCKAGLVFAYCVGDSFSHAYTV